MKDPLDSLFDAIHSPFAPVWRTERGAIALIQQEADRIGHDAPKYLRLIVHPHVYRAAELFPGATVVSKSGRRLHVDECEGMTEPVLIVHDGSRQPPPDAFWAGV